MTTKSATPMITERFTERCQDGAGGTRTCLPPRWGCAFAFGVGFCVGFDLPFSGLSSTVGST